MLIDILNELHESIDAEWQYVNKIINNLDRSVVKTIFDDVVTIDFHKERIRELRARHGIYIALVTEDINLSGDDIEKYNSIKGAKWKDQARTELWTDECFYTGSVISVSLMTRINQHFSCRTSSCSMHLEHPSRIIMRDKVKINVFPIKKEYDRIEYLKLIIPELERKMHEVFYPVTGSSRT